MARSKALFVYTDQEARITKRLWDETMAELLFAGVQDILRSCCDA